MRKSIVLLCFILALSFLVRTVFEDPWYSGLDPYLYYTNAERIVDGRVEQLSLWVWFIGYPLLISFFFLVFGVSLHSAVFVASLLGTLTVLAVYLLGRELVSEEAGLFSALILSLSPAHAHLSMTIMSDAPGLFFVVLAVFLYTKFLRSGKSVFLYLASFVFGWAVLVKYSNGVLILLPILHKFASGGLPAVKSNIRIYALSAVILLIALSPQLAYNFMHYGNPLAFTVLTTDSETETGLSLRNAFTTGYLRNIPPITHYPYTLFFKYNILSPFLLLFYPLGVFFFIKEGHKNEIIILSLWFSLNFISLVFFVSHDTPTRFAIVLLPPLTIIGSAGLCYTVKRVFGVGYRRVLLFFGVFYLVMVVPTYWLITDNVRVHGVEGDFQRLVHDATEEDAFIIASPHHLDEHIRPIMGREAVDIRVALAGSLDHRDPAVDEELKKLGDSRSREEKLASLFSEHPHFYVLVSQYGNDEVENFDVLEERASLRLIREGQLRLSMMSPWREYSIYLYRVDGLR